MLCLMDMSEICCKIQKTERIRHTIYQPTKSSKQKKRKLDNSGN